MKKYLRLPITTDRSLKAWSAIDEYILRYVEENDFDLSHTVIFHDRFGYLTCNLANYQPTSVFYLESQRQAILKNAATNEINRANLQITSLLKEPTKKVQVGIIKVPKSLDLFRLYLIQLIQKIESNGIVVAGFMTRHFTKAMLEIAAEYFETVEQSKAWKKSRLLILSQPKKVSQTQLDIFKTIHHDQVDYQQYLGVFSANHIDYATQFLLQKLTFYDSEKSFLDVGCGNGIIGRHLLASKDWQEAVLIDDSFLATASAELNLKDFPSATIQSQYHLDDFTDGQFDLVITNPPFHFEYEVDPSIAIQLLHDAHRILSNHGRLVIVANRHLNYKSQLSKRYSKIDVVSENDKFVIYEAKK